MVMLVDLRKAFDRTYHQKLLAKLEYLEFAMTYRKVISPAGHNTLLFRYNNVFIIKTVLTRKKYNKISEAFNRHVPVFFSKGI